MNSFLESNADSQLSSDDWQTLSLEEMSIRLQMSMCWDLAWSTSETLGMQSSLPKEAPKP